MIHNIIYKSTSSKMSVLNVAVVIVVCWSIEVRSTLLYKPFSVGNTFSNCIPPVNCASCDDEYEKEHIFRSIDGTCNNLRNPSLGATNTPLRRLLRADYTDGVDTPRGFPGTELIPPANKVSEELFNVEKQNKGTGELAVLFMTMGQFLDHDMGLAAHTDCNVDDCSSLDAFQYPCFPILFENGGTQCTGFGRALPVCQSHLKKRDRKPRNQVNILTAFIDGSQIYSSHFKQHQRVRRQDGTGTMKLSEEGLMELDEERQPCPILGGCSLVGDNRGDENVALHTMHTMWIREHNRIARQLKVINPSWEEEMLYQTTRKIIGAMLQHIIYEEWLPNVVSLPSYIGYRRRLNPTIINAFSAVAFRFGHSLIPNKFSQLDKNFDTVSTPVTLQEALRNRQIVNDNGIEPIAFGLLGNRSNNVDNGFAFGIARKLFVRPGKTGRVDLTALNIQRGRDHGIPTYGKWRKICRLPRVNTFQDLSEYMLEGTVEVFQRLYRTPDDIDLFAAGVSEKHASGLQVGPTFECLFRKQFTRLREGDRFFYRASGVFTPTQLKEIKKASMARVYCNTMKEIVSIQPKAFLVESSSNRRISCSRIDKVNLYAWKK